MRLHSPDDRVSEYMTNVMLKHIEWLGYAAAVEISPNGVAASATDKEGHTYMVRSDNVDAYAAVCSLAEKLGVELEDG
jgi:hypothetical protein